MSTEAIFAPAGLLRLGRSRSLHWLTDEELVALAQEGSTMASERLMFLFGPLVRSVARNFFVKGSEGDDVMQEGYVGLCRAIRSFSPGSGSPFRTFASLCITRQIQTAARDAARVKHSFLNGAVSLQSLEIEANVLDDSLPGLLSEFCTGLTGFELTVLKEYIRGRSYSDIGISLGCCPKSVDNGIQRARRKILSNRQAALLEPTL